MIEILRFKSKVIEGLRQLDAGEGIPHKEMVKRVDKHAYSDKPKQALKP